MWLNDARVRKETDPTRLWFGAMETEDIDVVYKNDDDMLPDQKHFKHVFDSGRKIHHTSWKDPKGINQG